MGFLSDLIFGSDEPSNSGYYQSETKSKPKQKSTNYNSYDRYDRYYEGLHDDAKCGDKMAEAEMREEFGDDWENEY